MEPTPPEDEPPSSRPGSAASVTQSVAQSVAVSSKGELPQLHEVAFEYEIFNGRRIKRRVNKPIRLDSPRLVRTFAASYAFSLRRLAAPSGNLRHNDSPMSRAYARTYARHAGERDEA